MRPALEAGVDRLEVPGGGIFEDFAVGGYKRAIRRLGCRNENQVSGITMNTSRQFPCIDCCFGQQICDVHTIGRLNPPSPKLRTYPKDHTTFSDQHSCFPKGNRGEQHFIAVTAINDEPARLFSQILVTLGKPDEWVSIQKDQWPVPESSSSRSSSAFHGPSHTGSSGSESSRYAGCARKPKVSGGRSVLGGGCNSPTGRPRLVIVTGSPVRSTSARIRRQCVLNSAAPIILPMAAAPELVTSYSHFAGQRPS